MQLAPDARLTQLAAWIAEQHAAPRLRRRPSRPSSWRRDHLGCSSRRRTSSCRHQRPEPARGAADAPQLDTLFAPAGVHALRRLHSVAEAATRPVLALQLSLRRALRGCRAGCRPGRRSRSGHAAQGVSRPSSPSRSRMVRSHAARSTRLPSPDFACAHAAARACIASSCWPGALGTTVVANFPLYVGAADTEATIRVRGRRAHGDRDGRRGTDALLHC